MTEQAPLHWCYRCGRDQIGRAERCAECGADLTVSDVRARFGVAYLLDQLPELAARDGLPGDVAERIRERLVAELRGRDTPQAAAPRATARPSARHEATPEPTAPGLDAFRSLVATVLASGTPSLLLYVGAFLIVVSAFIFVSVSGEQISDPVKLVLMLAGTIGFLGAGVACHRVPLVQPAGRTFLVIGALIAPLDIAAYYLLVAHASPLDAPTLWASGSLVCAALYAGLRIAGYGRGYSHLCYAALLSTVFGIEAAAKIPLAWVPVPFAAFALTLERARSLTTPILATLLEPLARMNMVVGAVTGLAIALPLGATPVTDRLAIPVEGALLTGYYAMRSPAGARWERVLAALGPATIVLGSAFAIGADAAALGVVAVLLGCAYVAVEVAPPIARAVAAVAPWTGDEITWIGLALVVGGLLPLGAFGHATAEGAVAYLAAGALFATLSLVWDRRPGRTVLLRSELLVVPAALALAVGYRFALDAVGLAPLPRNGNVELARMYAPFTFALWAAAIALRGRPSHALLVAGIAAATSVAVSLGSLADAPTQTVVGLAYAAGAATAGLRLADRRVLWVAGVAAMLGTLGALAWSGLPALWSPLVALVPGALAYAGSWVPAARRSRGALAEIGIAAAAFAVALGWWHAIGTRDPWDTTLWRTTMLALAAAGAFAALEAGRRRSIEGGVLAALALPLLVDMTVAMLHPGVPEPLTAPFAVYLYAAVWVARHSRRHAFVVATTPIEYAAALFAIVPTLRLGDVWLMLAAGVIGLAMLGAASRWRLEPTAFVAIGALATLAARDLVTDPRFDELRVALGAAVIALSVANVRAPRLFSTPGIRVAEIVGAALVCLPTAAVVALLPRAYDTDLPVALLLCAEIAAVLTVGVVFQRVALVRAGIVAACGAALIFLSLGRFGEWYAALLGSAMLNAALTIRRRWPAALGDRDRVLLSTLGVGVLFLPSVIPTLSHADLTRTAQVLAGALGVIVAAGLLGERWIVASALAVAGIEAVAVSLAPALLQPAGVGAGVALLAVGIAYPRLRRGGLPRAFETAFDALGAWLYLLPTFLLTWRPDPALQNAIFMAQLLLLLGAGLTFRRRWQLTIAVGALGLQSVRAIVDVANRIPNWATFAIAGALLLAIGFLLLLKRELFARWRRRLVRWWVAWLATPS